MLYSPYQYRMPTSTNCSGVKRKNTQNSVRWSPGRVGVIVMNSRKAQNEISPKRTTVTTWPSRKAAARVANRIHQARTRQPERLEDGRVDAALRPAPEHLDNAPGGAQQHQHRADQAQGFRVRRCSRPAIDLLQPPHRLAGRGRRKSVFASPASSHIGGPKVMQLSIGTGSTSPRGRMRFMLSMWTGINSRSGRFLHK